MKQKKTININKYVGKGCEAVVMGFGFVDIYCFLLFVFKLVYILLNSGL
jgi:hypothetical protein